MLAQTPAMPPTAGPGEPTARDMYVSCFLFVNKAEAGKGDVANRPLYSATTCAATALALIVNREGKRPNTRYTFCLPQSVDVDSDPARAMALAYLDSYEALWVKAPASGGRPAFLLAMVNKWPCSR